MGGRTENILSKCVENGFGLAKGELIYGQLSLVVKLRMGTWEKGRSGERTVEGFLPSVHIICKTFGIKTCNVLIFSKSCFPPPPSSHGFMRIGGRFDRAGRAKKEACVSPHLQFLTPHMSLETQCDVATDPSRQMLVHCTLTENGSWQIGFGEQKESAMDSSPTGDGCSTLLSSMRGDFPAQSSPPPDTFLQPSSLWISKPG